MIWYDLDGASFCFWVYSTPYFLLPPLSPSLSFFCLFILLLRLLLFSLSLSLFAKLHCKVCFTVPRTDKRYMVQVAILGSILQRLGPGHLAGCRSVLHGVYATGILYKWLALLYIYISLSLSLSYMFREYGKRVRGGRRNFPSPVTRHPSHYSID